MTPFASTAQIAVQNRSILLEDDSGTEIQEQLDLTEADQVSAAMEGTDASAAAFDWPLLGNFLILMAVCAFVAYLLECVYKRCGYSLSNRSDFSRNFVMLSCATMMIVTIVKSSLALSLGLVGALSIVRFRAAIKEPEELCFLFLAIGIGLGFGASVGLGFLRPEPYIPIVSFAFLTGVLFLRRRFRKKDTGGDYHVLVASEQPSQVGHDQIQKVISSHSQDAALKRLDESRAIMEANYQVHFESPDQLERCRQALLALGDPISVSMMDNRGLGN